MRRRLLSLPLILLLFSPLLSATTRHYYIAAEDVSWDYAPSARDLIASRPIPPTWRTHAGWTKTRFIEYTDATFSVRKPQPQWFGILGPIIRAEVGDEIDVDFLNRGKVPHSIHPHGLRYDKDNEGALYVPPRRGSRVPPGGRFSYRWFADSGSGPGPGQLTSVVWWYHGHTDEPRETNAGMEGPIIVTAKGKANPDGTPKGVDRELVASFMIFDELDGKPTGQFYAINGYIFGNLPGLDIKRGERVRWYLMALGSETGLHSPHWYGKTVNDGTRHVDVVELLPGSTSAVDMVADNLGTWLLHCHVSDHMEAGMMATFTIYQPGTRACPIKLRAGSFWDSSDHFNIEVENSGEKAIRSLTLVSEHLLGPQYLHRPFTDANWELRQSLAPRAKQALEKKAYASEIKRQILGWVFFPGSITYEDGTTWKPQQDGECFQVFWRDPDHPELPVLPPPQVEINED